MTRPSFPRRVLTRLFSRTAEGWFDVALNVVAWGVILSMIGWSCAPLFDRLDTYGVHDWDTMEAHRYLTVKSLGQYHQFPFWNPYACGGHTNWGNFEGGSNIISPFLPVYLASPFALAVRIEIVGTAVLGAVGAWLFAGRFTKRAVIRAFVVVVCVVNGRWALQATAGHSWHLYYSWLPWALFFFDRASDTGERASARPWRDAVLAGAVLALIVYAGGIYPLPQTASILGAYALLLAVTSRSLQPLKAIALTGVTALGFSAPKLFPLLDMLSRYPRYSNSGESIDLFAFMQILTARGQDLDSHPAPVPVWRWQEYGMYIGWVPLIVVGIGMFVARGPRVSPLKWVGLACVAIAFGNFHPASPWNIVHEIPIFRSQHVPSRWLYVAPILLTCALAPVADRALSWLRRARYLVEPLLLAAVTWVAFDIAREARVPISHAFTLELPSGAKQQAAEFHTEKLVPGNLQFAVREYYAPSLPAEMAGVGVIDCGTFPGLHRGNRQGDVGPGLGARGRGDPEYRGEAYTASGTGHARIAEFTPNVMTVEVEDGTPGDLVILNQNFEGGWSVDGDHAINWHDAVAAEIRTPSQRFVFSYTPRTWGTGLAAFALTVVGLVAGWWWTRRRRARAPIPVPSPAGAEEG